MNELNDRKSVHKNDDNQMLGCAKEWREIIADGTINSLSTVINET